MQHALLVLARQEEEDDSPWGTLEPISGSVRHCYHLTYIIHLLSYYFFSYEHIRTKHAKNET
jgi:hypothetical protein